MLWLQTASLPGSVHQFPAVPRGAENACAVARGDDERSGPGPGHSAPPCVCAPLCQRRCTLFCVPARAGKCHPILVYNNQQSTACAGFFCRLSSLGSSKLFDAVNRRVKYVVGSVSGLFDKSSPTSKTEGMKIVNPINYWIYDQCIQLFTQ